jgi:single-strand DNA-binding protein
MNKVFLSGNLTKDPEVRYTQSGMAYAKMGIAVSRPFSSKNNDGQPATDFFNLTAWNKTAEFCGRYLNKGSRVLVEGRIQNDNYEDKNGVKHYAVSVMVDNIEFASSKRRGDNTTGEDGETGGGNGGDIDTDNGEGIDVPF